MYTPTSEEIERLKNDFTYHAPSESQIKRYGQIRHEAGLFAGMLLMQCPPSRERSLALTNLETAVFFANAAIARNEKPAEQQGAGSRQ